MPWISSRSADKLVIKRCFKMGVGSVLRIESFKGDRWLEIKRLDMDRFEVREHGFNESSVIVDSETLKPAVKRIMSMEFPRSHQLRISSID
ncbi:MAG: hypothetical protein ACP5NY_05090 [Thermocladium sp.]